LLQQRFVAHDSTLKVQKNIIK